jgi:AraC-like DNA-binding protein
MKMHYSYGITVDEAAKFAGVDRTHFSKRFRKFGISPGEYIKSLIMKEAGQMLLETNFSVSEIAYSLGFSNLYSFSKAYKSTLAYHRRCPAVRRFKENNAAIQVLFAFPKQK